MSESKADRRGRGVGLVTASAIGAAVGVLWILAPVYLVLVVVCAAWAFALD